MSKLAHSSDEHMEQIERDAYTRDGLALSVSAACRAGALQQAGNLAYGRILGTWPGDETDEEIERAIAQMDAGEDRQSPDVTMREGFATDLMERIWRAAGPDYRGREALVEAVMSAARQWEAVR